MLHKFCHTYHPVHLVKLVAECVWKVSFAAVLARWRNCDEKEDRTFLDTNHFSEDYFANQEWDNPDLIRSEESFRIAREKFEADRRTIIDATVDGACDVFDKRPLEYCFE